MKSESRRLVAEGVCANTPPVKEQAQADGLEGTGKSADGDRIQRALLGEDLGDELRIHVNRFTI